MNPLPILALIGVAAVYVVATERTNEEFAARAAPAPSPYAAPANAGLAVFSLVEKAAPALDSPRCEAQAQMATVLMRDYDEAPVETRVVGDGLQVQLWGSLGAGTWTLVHNGSDGVSCVVSSGTNWTASSTPDDVFNSAPLAS